jgi:MarR family transcriptional regulator, transcriptional regulator for hemolysin
MIMNRMKNFGFLLKDLARLYVARFEAHASDLSLTLTQCKVLTLLEKNEGTSQIRLAELTDIEPMMMVRLLDRMETDKLLERRPDPTDRRARRLFLTRKAKPLLDEIWRLAEVTRTEVFAGVSKSDRDLFIGVLEQLHTNACAWDKQPAIDSTQTPVLKRARAARASSKLTKQAI